MHADDVEVLIEILSKPIENDYLLDVWVTNNYSDHTWDELCEIREHSDVDVVPFFTYN
jgi:hypothetical protein